MTIFPERLHISAPNQPLHARLLHTDSKKMRLHYEAMYQAYHAMKQENMIFMEQIVDLRRDKLLREQQKAVEDSAAEAARKLRQKNLRGHTIGSPMQAFRETREYDTLIRQIRKAEKDRDDLAITVKELTPYKTLVEELRAEIYALTQQRRKVEDDRDAAKKQLTELRKQNAKAWNSTMEMRRTQFEASKAKAEAPAPAPVALMTAADVLKMMRTTQASTVTRFPLPVRGSKSPGGGQSPRKASPPRAQSPRTMTWPFEPASRMIMPRDLRPVLQKNTPFRFTPDMSPEDSLC
eukprot:GEMP01034469.1.p1 GENE.GEMP01034469.1~~GEMP01034469.1.p1  ORF type:complete len:293 (+),score=68.58 GEMP01034469.1:70-948(+)